MICIASSLLNTFLSRVQQAKQMTTFCDPSRDSSEVPFRMPGDRMIEESNLYSSGENPTYNEKTTQNEWVRKNVCLHVAKYQDENLNLTEDLRLRLEKHHNNQQLDENTPHRMSSNPNSFFDGVNSS